MKKLIYQGPMPTCETVDSKPDSPTRGQRFLFARDKSTEVPDHVAADLLKRHEVDKDFIAEIPVYATAKGDK